MLFYCSRAPTDLHSTHAFSKSNSPGSTSPLAESPSLKLSCLICIPLEPTHSFEPQWIILLPWDLLRLLQTLWFTQLMSPISAKQRPTTCHRKGAVTSKSWNSDFTWWGITLPWFSLTFLVLPFQVLPHLPVSSWTNAQLWVPWLFFFLFRHSLGETSVSYLNITCDNYLKVLPFTLWVSYLNSRLVSTT